MPDFRCFCRPASLEPKQIELSDDESHHLVSVNRARVGDTVVAFNGQGTEWICELAALVRGVATLKVRFLQKATPLPYSITLAQALPKGKFMDSIVRKATELGVARIVPIVSERTEVRIEEEREETKLERWRAAATESAKQCGNPWLPEIAPVQRASEFIAQASGYDLKLIASLQPGAKSLKNILHEARTSGRTIRKVLWLVGPEGDFTPAEFSQTKNANFEPVTLGPLVLRCETAATYALSILSYELQNA